MNYLVITLALALALALPACRDAQETTGQAGTPPAATSPPEPSAQQPSQPTAQQPAEPTAQQPAATPAGVDMQVGERVYQQACATCHAQGIAGAPRQGDKEDWGPRIAKGMETLVRHSIEGFQGNRGVMPPRGGNPNLTDQEVASAVAYMVQINR